jgi:mono/diheme cytochrome c family protein
MSSMKSLGWVLCCAALATGCEKKVFSEPVKLAGEKTLDVAQLNDGHEAFMLYCYACHGAKGDGLGPAAYAMRPPPRNFHQGLFKFAGGAAGQLPTDAALMRTIRRGLHGTPMLAWDIPEVERTAIVAYLKTLSPRWKEEEAGADLEISPDPWGTKKDEAIQKGKEVYHVAAADHAGCASCHAGYVTREELSEMAKKVTGEPISDFNPEMNRAMLRPTEYAIETDDKGEATKVHQILPPDFLFHRVKTAYPLGTMVDGKPYSEEAQREDLYRTIGAGIGGAAMPQWKGALPEENLWALVYYVQSLVNLRGTAEGNALRAKLDAQPPLPEAPAEPAP